MLFLFLPVILRPTFKLSIKILKRTQTRQSDETTAADKKTHPEIRMKLIIYLKRHKSFNGGTLSSIKEDEREKTRAHPFL